MVYARVVSVVFFFQAEDGIRDLVRSRGLGDVYKRQAEGGSHHLLDDVDLLVGAPRGGDAPDRADAVALLLSLIHI